MIISSITINNVRSYESCHIDFDSGTTLLIGDIGSGKSSILMAIEFALFGFGGQTSDAILTKGRESGSVHLAFESGGHSYEIFRSIKITRGKITQDTKSAWISTDGVRDETLGVGELKQKVIEILGTDEPGGTSAETSIFRYAVYTPQEDMQAVLSNPVKRQESIRRAFKIDGFSTALENSKKLVSEIKRTVKEYSIRFENIGDWEEKMSMYKDRIDDLNSIMVLKDADCKAAAIQVKFCEESYIKLESELAAKNKAAGEADILESQITGIQQNIAELTEEIDECSNNADLLREKLNEGLPEKPECSMTVRQLNDTVAVLRPRTDELIRVSTQIETLDSEIQAMQSSYDVIDIGPLQSKVRQITDDIDTSKSLRDSLMKLNSAIKQHISMLKENVDGLRTGDSCPLCQQNLAADSGIEIVKTVSEKIARLESELEQTISKTGKTDDHITLMEAELTKIQNELQAAKNAEELAVSVRVKSDKLKSLRADEVSLQKDKVRMDELENLRINMSEYEDNLSALAEAKHSLDSLESQINKASQNISTDRQKMHSLVESLDKKRIEIAQFDSLDNTMNNVKSTLDEWRAKESKAREEMAVARTDLKNAHDSIFECQKELTDCNSWKVKHGKLGRYQEWMEKIFMPSLQIMEEQSLEYVRTRFNRLYGDFYSMLLDDSTKESNIDADFTPIVTESGHEQSVHNLSGGEKTSIALAYRLTLARMVREDSGIESGVLMLDEPTDGFSKSQLEKVRAVLDEAGATQVILVSHDAELESYADRIYRVSKFGGRSQIAS